MKLEDLPQNIQSGICQKAAKFATDLRIKADGKPNMTVWGDNYDAEIDKLTDEYVYLKRRQEMKKYERRSTIQNLFEAEESHEGRHDLEP